MRLGKVEIGLERLGEFERGGERLVEIGIVWVRLG